VINEYLQHYKEQLRHQQQHRMGEFPLWDDQPWEHCFACLREGIAPGKRAHPVKLHYSWAIPNDAALRAIAQYSPNGVVEIGAGGGYWAKMLREIGVSVIAYDPDPVGGSWHDGTRWSEVLLGDHTSVIGHTDRTLLLVWPSYNETWTDEVLDLYDGDTVIYIGEGSGGCTGTDRMHQILGSSGSCWCIDDCDCPPKEAGRFRQVDEVHIPQWAGLHDALTVYRRVASDAEAPS
jgi:hypothetical protein